MTRVALRSIGVCAVVTVAIVCWHTAAVLSLMLAAILVARSIEPVATRLRFVCKTRRSSLTLAYVLVAAALLGFLVCIGFALADEVPTLGSDISSAYAAAHDRWASGGYVGRLLADRLPRSLVALPDEVTRAASLLRTADLLKVVAGLAWVVLLAICWSFAGDKIEAMLLSFMPLNARLRVQPAWLALRVKAGSVLAAEISRSLLIVLVSALAFRVLGLRYAMAAAVAIGVVRLVPFAGPALAIAVGALGGAASGSGSALAAASLTFAFVLGVRHVARPAPEEVAHPFVLALVTLVLLRSVGGLAVLLAAPLAAGLYGVVRVVMRDLVRPRPLSLVESGPMRLDT